MSVNHYRRDDGSIDADELLKYFQREREYMNEIMEHPSRIEYRHYKPRRWSEEEMDAWTDEEIERWSTDADAAWSGYNDDDNGDE